MVIMEQKNERMFLKKIFENESIYGLEVKMLKKNVLCDYVHEVKMK